LATSPLAIILLSRSRSDHRNPAGSRNKYELDWVSGQFKLFHVLLFCCALSRRLRLHSADVARDNDPLDILIAHQRANVHWMPDRLSPDYVVLRMLDHRSEPDEKRFSPCRA
jgi:hypothetical protein